MKTQSNPIAEQMEKLRKEREQVAYELQNEVNQTLAAVLLSLQFIQTGNNMPQEKSFSEIEINLKKAIDHVRNLHYSLSDNI